MIPRFRYRSPKYYVPLTAFLVLLLVLVLITPKAPEPFLPIAMALLLVAAMAFTFLWPLSVKFDAQGIHRIAQKTINWKDIKLVKWQHCGVLVVSPEVAYGIEFMQLSDPARLLELMRANIGHDILLQADREAERQMEELCSMTEVQQLALETRTAIASVISAAGALALMFAVYSVSVFQQLQRTAEFCHLSLSQVQELPGRVGLSRAAMTLTACGWNCSLIYTRLHMLGITTAVLILVAAVALMAFRRAVKLVASTQRKASQ